MKYTQIPQKMQEEVNRLKKDDFNPKMARAHPSYFSHHILGITPYKYQHLILRRFRQRDDRKLPNEKIIICKSRQIGISICLAILGIWYASLNQANGGRGTSIYNNTKVGIISRSEQQAKKLMSEIQSMIWNSKHGFKDVIQKNRENPLNKKEIHFEKGWIKCFAPTDACRGESFDLLIVDEAAFVDEDIFRDAMEPTVSATNGKIILSSTPRGQKGFFYDIFDPFDVHTTHEYDRYWLHWKMCENELQKRDIMNKLRFARKTGNTKSFDQEYNSLFTIDEEAFFESVDVDKNIDKTITSLYECHDVPCNIGIDYGGTGSATVITVTALRGKKCNMIFQYAKYGFDENLLMDPEWENSVPNLMRRYKVQWIVVDDCVQGTRTNRQLENEGYPVKKFNFRTDSSLGERNRGYYMFRSALKQGSIKYYRENKLLDEMKALMEIKVDHGRSMRITAPQNRNDDRIDSLMMSCHPFLCDDGHFQSTIVDYEKVFERMNRVKHDNGRFDNEWEQLKVKSDPYDFLLNTEAK